MTILRKTFIGNGRPRKATKQNVERYPCGQVKHKFRDLTPEQAVSVAVEARKRHGTRSAAGNPLEGAVVYVMTAGGFVKAGYTLNAARRQEQLQENNPYPVEIVWTGRASKEEAFAVEQSVHRRLRSGRSRVRGEWYSLCADAMIDVILEEARSLNVALMIGD